MRLALLLMLVFARGIQASAETPRFRVAEPSYRLNFPRDHGAHPEFQTEWWYFTGLLYREGEAAFVNAPLYGFQLTFFRRSSRPGDLSEWSQSYLAHAAIADLTAARFYHRELQNPGGLGVAEAASDSLRVLNGEWRAGQIGQTLQLNFRLNSPAGPLTLTLSADFRDVPIAHGLNGFSRKGVCEECASIYYSVPRLKWTGELRQGSRSTAVTGLGWMDHEFMSSALSGDQIGWDWFSLMRKDGTSLMLFQIRSTTDSRAIKAGTLISGSSARSLSPAEFSIESLDTWLSPHTKARYPSRWRIAVPSLSLDQELEPLLADQELSMQRAEAAPGVPTYWEGAISVPDRSTVGYAELTGYAGSLTKNF
ncbi:MAG: carotenoid 1,2-hydratase [Oligoflexia bacterium]|nr:carotenoid 1,2-hydratase [Oligoflexia bacterium]